MLVISEAAYSFGFCCIVIPRRKLEETNGTSSYYMDENHSARSEIQWPHYGWRSWPGSEPSTLEIDVYVWRYALLVVLARNDDEDDHRKILSDLY